MTKLILTALLTMSPMLAWANASAFGLTLGKTTEAELSAQYKATKEGVNKYSQGPMYLIPPSQVNFDGVKEFRVVFDQGGKLVAILATLNKSRFAEVNSMLKGKYKLVKQNIPFVGDSSATYKQGNTQINLNAPHLSFDMTLHYLNDDFLKAAQKSWREEEDQTRQRETNKL